MKNLLAKQQVGLRPIILGFLASLVAGSAFALPSLQLGPDSDSNWGYVADTGTGSTNTWLYTGGTPLGPFGFNAYGNATSDLGGVGDYAFNDGARTAYLVIAAVPESSDATDLFDIIVGLDGGTVSLFDSGFGQPPLADPNSLAPHGVYDTYFEIYQFVFDGSAGLIGNTQPGDSGTGQGYMESFTVDITTLAASVTGLHIDLFTVLTGTYDPSGEFDRNLVTDTAPFSHDLEWHPGDEPDPDPDPDPNPIPVPGTLLLLGLGLFSLRLIGRKAH